MATYPGKRHVTFTLDESRYVTLVTMSQAGYSVMPAILRHAD
jgi:hypothetical protein